MYTDGYNTIQMTARNDDVNVRKYSWLQAGSSTPITVVYTTDDLLQLE